MVTAASKKTKSRAKEIEREALVLFAGRPSVLEAFYELTDKKSLCLKWSPLDSPDDWEIDATPSDSDIKLLAAIKSLFEKGYIVSVTDAGTSHYIVTASEEAEAVRKVLDRLPESLKGLVKEELERTRA